ncbi:MAG: 3-alpha,7-alpha,12-alpha-trihydroxy-5-beta-cholest-24-enoyl-CoA hydratase [Actinomycetia bacterium]|nr:3-alpha,7-alpha,12-alpha-trihydroxy-5-beta-cholest-24-enoyl-CoA hydratase [Actinomycetes bacterium]
MGSVSVSSDLVGTELPEGTWSWGWRDAVLYALGIGARPGDGALVDAGADEGDLDFLFERRGPKVYPTFAVIPGMTALGGVSAVADLNVARLLHGEQAITMHRPFPAQGELTVKGRIVDVWDKGKAAVIGVESELVDADGPLATTYASLFAKGYGDFGGERGPDTSDIHQPPDREPDHVIDDVVRQEQAALYRLSGDRVTLHIDPDFARQAGYPGPFLHGLCTYGFAGRAVLRALCANEPERLRSMTGRFADLVWMNDHIITKIWETGDGEAVFRAETQTGAVVLSHAHVSYTS